MEDLDADVLLAGSLGALAVFVLGVALEWWRGERERRGLLRLLRSATEHNAVVVDTIAERRGERVVDWIGHPDLPSMKVETWRDVRQRAAALLPAEIMAALEGYYSPLETSLTLLGFQDAVSDTSDRELRAYIQQAMHERNVAATSNLYREYLEQALAAQNTVRGRINGYLALSMVDALLRLFGRIQPRNRKPTDYEGSVAPAARDETDHA